MKNIASVLILFVGSLYYYISKKNKELFYQALIRSFCFSNGRSNDFLSLIISTSQRLFKRSLLDTKSYQVDLVVKDLNEKGYYVIDNYFEESVLNNLINFTENHTCSSRKLLDENIVCSYETIVKKRDLSGINGTRLDYKESELVTNADVQKVILDSFFLDVAKKYLKALPIIDITALWWTLSGKNVDLVEDAQMFHFDMDRIKWLKVFVYLTDVDERNGPHVFVEGSHKTAGIPKRFLSRGYKRIEDSDVIEFYGPEKLKTFCGKKGTIIFEDTRGLHKGSPIIDGSRLVFQVEYTNALFGAPLRKEIDGFVPSDSAKEVLRAYS